MAYYSGRRYGWGYRRSSPIALFIIAVICVLGGPAVTFYAITHGAELKSFKEGAVELEGKVMGTLDRTKRSSRSSSTTHEYSLTVQFVDPDGHTIEEKRKVDQKIFDQYPLVDGGPALPCKVAFNKAQPDKWTLPEQLDSDIKTNAMMVWAAPLIGLVLALVFAGSGLFALSRSRAAMAAMSVMPGGMPYPAGGQPYPQAPVPYPGGPQPYPQQPQGGQPYQQPPQPYPQQGQQPPYGGGQVNYPPPKQ